MRLFAVLFGVLLSLLALTACSGDDSDISAGTTSTTVAEQPTSTDAPPPSTSTTTTTQVALPTAEQLEAELLARPLDSEEDRTELLLAYCGEIPADYVQASEEFFASYQQALTVAVSAFEQAHREAFGPVFARFEASLAAASSDRTGTDSADADRTGTDSTDTDQANTDHIDIVDTFFLEVQELADAPAAQAAFNTAFRAALPAKYGEVSFDPLIDTADPTGITYPAEVYEKLNTATFSALEAATFYAQLALGTLPGVGGGSGDGDSSNGLETIEANENDLAAASFEVIRLSIDYLDTATEVGAFGLTQSRLFVVDQVLFAEPLANPLDDFARTAALACART